MSIIFGADLSGNGNNWTTNNLVNSGSSTAQTVTFTTVGTATWTPPANVTSVSYLVVAGGGGGGGNIGGGGGAGGMLTGTLAVTPGTSYNITIGDGGAGGAGATSNSGVNGSNSVFASVTALGGGYGGSGTSSYIGGAGGSGGGGARAQAGAATHAGGAGTSGQGNNGGSSVYAGGSNNNTAAGGGGAGAVGGNAGNGSNGAGGAGLSSSISGSSVTYAGGGGGGSFQNDAGTGGAGGSGGGGAGTPNGSTGGAGTANTGGGAGGGGQATAGAQGAGGTGGSGIVILSYTVNNSISTYDSMVDVPGIASVSSQSEVGGIQRGNYNTFNPLDKGSNLTLSDGNLKVVSSSNPNNSVRGTIGFSSGKWYWEYSVTSGSPGAVGGIAGDDCSVTSNFSGSMYAYDSNGYKCINGTETSYGATYTTNDIIGVAADLDNGQITFYKNNVSQGTITGIPLNQQWRTFNHWNTVTGVANFGQRAFTYTPPVGFKSLCTTNLPNPVIKKPTDHFDVKTWTGNGTSLTVGNTQKQTSAYAITKSVRQRDGSVERGFTRINSAAGNTQKMTVSCWVKRARTGITSSPSEHNIYSAATSAIGSTGRDFFGFAGSSTGTVTDSLTFGTNTTGGAWSFVYTNNTFLDTTRWQHLVLAIDTTQASAANRVIIYVNGVRQTLSGTYPTQNLSLIMNSAAAIGIGRWPFNNSSFEGEIAEYNFIDGQQLTPSSFGIFDANNNWVPQAYTSTYGTNGFYLPFNSAPSLGNTAYAAKFNSSNYLSLPSNAGYAFGTGDFTVEGWFNVTAFNGSYSSLVTTRGVSGTGFDIQVYAVNNQLMLGNPSGAIVSANNVIPLNTWTHIAGVRISGVFYLYINGQLATSGASVQNFTDTAFYIGSGAGGGNNAWSGYASNVRVVKGVGVYTGTFTPPSSALTATQSAGTNIAAITGTSTVLLTCQNSTLVDNSTNNFTVTSSGTTAISSVYPYSAPPTYSGYFSGSSSNLNVANQTAFNPGTSDYCVEGWFYPTSIPASGIAGMFGINNGSGSNPKFCGYLDTSGYIHYDMTLSGGSSLITSSSTIKPNSWNHVAWVRSSNVATLYLNGVSVGTTSLTTNLTGITAPFYIGYVGEPSNCFAGYISNFRYVKGAPVYTTTFTPPTAPLTAITGTQILTLQSAAYVDNSSNNYTVNNTNSNIAINTVILPPLSTGLGKDNSGNNNHAGIINIDQFSGISTYDVLNDSPTDTVDSNSNPVGNYCVIDPSYSGTVVTNGALTSTGNSANNISFGTLGVSTGKWYYETTVVTYGYPVMKVGLANKTATGELGDTTTGWGFITQNNGNAGQGVHSGSVSSTTYTSIAAGDILMFAWDCDAGKMWVGKNGTWLNSGVPTSGTGFIYGDLSGTIFPAYSNYNKGGSPTGIYNFNFGQQPWAYTPPTGFKSLNTKNLKDIGSYNLPDNFGNFVNTPDLVWMKSRSNATNHVLYDTVRGVAQTLSTSSNAAQSSSGGTALQAFLPNGYRLGADNSDIGSCNNAGYTYVGWAWNRGQTPGFDIVNYAGTGSLLNVPHNLGATPKFIIVKTTSSGGTYDWYVYHSSLLNTEALYLNLTLAKATSSGLWGSTSPTSNAFTVGGSSNGTNISGLTYIAYLWAEVPGFSKFGSYTGNGSSDGPFIYTGFRPRWIMIKNVSSATNDWALFDTSREPFNNNNANGLKPNSTSAEYTGNNFHDTLSNGFKMRNGDSDTNTSGSTYVYAAFAETPFKYANAR